ncbi:MAG: N-acetylglucosamine kinase [Hyphomicrobiales bacterium]|nr:MAG: N-acetylglucosamine kinase [Hyphomicrobiales bacterium]
MSGAMHMGIDVGGTACRWVLCDGEGREVARGATSGATGHVFNPVERERLETALRVIAAEAAPHAPAIEALTVGMTGYGSTVATEVKALLSAIFHTPVDRLIVIDDIMLAYAAVFAPGEGHLVSAGTGSIGLHVAEDGSFVRVGGRGILVDDAGSGSWIALRAIDRVFRTEDNTGSFAAVGPLARELFTTVGGHDWHAVRQFVYGSDRGRIGTLATAVAAAARDGDQTALAILEAAGRELAALAKALVARAGARPVGFIGGVLGLHPAVTDTIVAELTGLDVRFPKADAALAAAHLQLPASAGWRTTFSAIQVP